MGGGTSPSWLEERPGAYILVGNGDTASVHHPEYKFQRRGDPPPAVPGGPIFIIYGNIKGGIVEQRMPAAG